MCLDVASSVASTVLYHPFSGMLAQSGEYHNENPRVVGSRLKERSNLTYILTSLINGVLNVPTCPTYPTCPRALRALRELRAHAFYVLYVSYMSTHPKCPMCPCAQVSFTARKIKKRKFCTQTFLMVLSLTLDLNFRNYSFIQIGRLSLFSKTHKRNLQIEFLSYRKLTFCSNNVSSNVLQQTHISIWI